MKAFKKKKAIIKNKFSQSRWHLGIFLGLVAVLLPEFAWAAPSFFEPVPGDKSVEMLLKPIFGELFGGPVAAGLMGAVKVFNAAALTVGGLLAAYTLIFGTMQTAHDGEMLGKKWSSMWLPIRTVLGVGLVMPVASGFCVAQLLVAWITLQGVGLADQLWSSYVKGFASSAGMGPQVAMPATREFAKGVLLNMTCVEAGKHFATTTPQIWTNSFSATNQSGGQGRLYGTSDYPNLCGAVNYAAIKPPVISPNMSSILQLGSTDAERTAAATAIKNDHITATIQLETALQPLAAAIVKQTFVTGAPLADAGLLDAAAEEYQKSVSQAAGSVFGGADALTPVKNSASQDGWILAGSWFMRSSQLQDIVTKAASSTPVSIAPVNSSAGANYQDQDFARVYAKLDGVLGRSVGSYGIENSAAAGGGGNDVDKWSKETFHHFLEPMAKGFQLKENRHPMMALKDFGDYLMVGSEAAIILAGGLMAKAGISSVGTLTAAIMYFGLLVFTLLGSLIVFAAMASVYFPVLPFIIFFGTALGWLILVAEAVIAIPLAAVMKLTPGGDDVMGGAKQAYMLLLGLALRPALIVFGFILSLIGVEHIIRLFNQVFFPVFFSSMGESVVGVVTLVIGVGIYFGTLTYMLHKLFGLCHVVPDQLLRWIGGGHEQLGSWGGGSAEAAKGNVGAVVGNISNKTQSASDATGRNLAMGKQRDDAKLQSEMTEKKNAASEARSGSMELSGMSAAASTSAAAASGPGSKPADTVQAVADRFAVAQKHANVGQSFSSAGNEEGAAKHNKSAAMEMSAANKLADGLESRGASAQKSAENHSLTSGTAERPQAAASFREAEALYKAGRDAQNVLGNREKADELNQRGDEAGRRASLIEAELASDPKTATPDASQQPTTPTQGKAEQANPPAGNPDNGGNDPTKQGE